MGEPDTYPFVLAPPVLEKLRFIGGLVQLARPERAARGESRAEPEGGAEAQ